MTGFNLTNIIEINTNFVDFNINNMPTFFMGSFFIDNTQDIQDTFLHVQEAKYGVVFVNSVNVGCYRNFGLQKTLYIIKHILDTGENMIYIFSNIFHIVFFFFFFVL